MKYYSDLIDKCFESEEECVKAESEFKKAKEEKEAAKKQELAQISADKKELSKAIDDADARLTQAYADYDLAKEEASKIIEEAKQKAVDLLSPAREAVKVAQTEKCKALSNFNKKYGTYNIVYTGDKALEEYQRISRYMNDFFNGTFKKFFW